MLTSDRDTILKIKNGEIDKYSILVEKYTPTIYRYVKSRINVREDAEDLVQNIFISFYKSIPRFEEIKPVLPYLYKIAQNELKMFYRSKKPTVPLNESIIAKEEEIYFDKDQLKKLNTYEKELLLSMADGYSYEELGKKYKISINTLKSQIRRARLKIKKAYEKT